MVGAQGRALSVGFENIMIKLLARAVNCTRGIHERDASRAYQDEKGWVSVCTRCGTPVRRGLDRKWHEYEPQA